MGLMQADRLKSIGEAIFVAAGAPPATARIVVSALVNANLVGHDSHGVQHIPEYVRSIKVGEIDPRGEASIHRETPVTATVHGAWNFGQVTAEFAIRLAVAKAKASGIAAIGVVQVNHIGRLGEYAEIAAREGIIAIVAAGGFAEGKRGQAVPFGGAQPILGTNPVAVGFPTGRHDTMFLDFATTSIAAGKIQVARAKGLQLPPGSIIDRDGRPTTDPNAYYEGGALLPFGGHKGYGLAMAMEFLGRVVTGSEQFADQKRGGPFFASSGTMIIGINPAAFGDEDDYRYRADATIDRVKGVPPADGFTEVLVPGEPEHRSRVERMRDGIPVPKQTWDGIRETAIALGLNDPGAE